MVADGDNNEDSPDHAVKRDAVQPAKSRRRNRPVMMIIGTVAVALIAFAALFAWQSDSADTTTTTAQRDASKLALATSDAQRAADAFDAGVEVVAQFVSDVGSPAHAAASENEKDFSAETIDDLGHSLSGLDQLMQSPLDESHDDAGDQSPPVLMPSSEIITGEPRSYADTLKKRYRSLSESELAKERERIEDERVRLIQMTDILEAATTKLHSGLDKAEQAAVAVAADGARQGKKLALASRYASTKSTEALSSAVSSLADVAATPLPVSWDDRMRGDEAPLAELAGDVHAYVDAATTVRSSESKNKP